MKAIPFAIFIFLFACGDNQNVPGSETAAHSPGMDTSDQSGVSPKPSEAAPAPVTSGSEDGPAPATDFKQAFNEKYPAAADVSWGEDKNGYHEASFKLNGEKLRADFTHDGKWVQTEASVKFDELPPAVKNVIKTDFDKGDIVEIEKVENREKGLFFDIEFDKKKGKVDIEIKSDGTVVGKESSKNN